ncbi:MAG: fasciclin domain-containing protein [Cyclobacteriaceae bacterium]
MKNMINPLKALAMFAVAFGLIFTVSCSDDDDDKGPDCTEVELYADADGDGLGDASAAAMVCPDEEGYVDNAYDNNDASDFASSTIMDIVNNVEGLDSLKKYLNVYPNLVGALSAQGTYTAFLPTNAAFIGLLETPGFPQNISSINPDVIEGVLAYHVAATAYTSAELTSGTEVTTISQGEKITVNSDGTLKTGSSNPNIVVEVADIVASNGVAHITSSVLISPSVGASLTPLLNTLGGTIMLGADFSLLAQAILKADTFATSASQATIVSMLADKDATLTVFAPSNGTFETAADGNFGDQNGEASAAEIAAFMNFYSGQQFYGIIATHLVTSAVGPADLTTGATFTAASGATLTVLTTEAPTNVDKGILTGIAIDSNGDTTAEAQVAVPSTASDALVQPNGQVHVIAGLMTPPQ